MSLIKQRNFAIAIATIITTTVIFPTPIIAIIVLSKIRPCLTVLLSLQLLLLDVSCLYAKT